MLFLMRPAFLLGLVLPALMGSDLSAQASARYRGTAAPASASSNGYGTNAANSTAVGAPVGAYGGYVVNNYGFGNYVSGPAGYGGYPSGSAGAQIWKQREEWKCQNSPESC
ncbi:hypothetical protein P7D22_02340 [Lichenihabitans sp. Uapishka_5]|uniref:hypothetical protein n=1 Tax=Lichenihabitans sp. Uapishka_5 TaxID=3037302 RepID=UPI0029E7DF71|nr:hypothetical protein [Lichenihabitans sp. Uapishka_5]MDX7950014.1 hypothetical protein [Lichenihabitans sp. Uapishka_5]